MRVAGAGTATEWESFGGEDAPFDGLYTIHDTFRWHARSAFFS